VTASPRMADGVLAALAGVGAPAGRYRRFCRGRGGRRCLRLGRRRCGTDTVGAQPAITNATRTMLDIPMRLFHSYWHESAQDSSTTSPSPPFYTNSGGMGPNSPAGSLTVLQVSRSPFVTAIVLGHRSVARGTSQGGQADSRVWTSLHVRAAEGGALAAALWIMVAIVMRATAGGLRAGRSLR